MSYNVAVVGGGFSAISLTINLLRALPPEASIAIVGDDAGFGRGTAYRTELHLHRLNVPAARMSAFAGEPDDFILWLRKRGRQVDGSSFASRGDYGLYLRDTLAGLLRSQDQRARVDFVKAKAISCLGCSEEGAKFVIDNGTALMADNVALCLGVGTASLPRLTHAVDASIQGRIIQNPWRLGWLSKVRPRDRICILGSGLTMIDQVLSLRAKGHLGQIDVLSRRGLVPHGHSETPVVAFGPELGTGHVEISQILSSLRRQVRTGAEWRAVMDGLRPKTQAMWQQLSQDQRSRFLRHALAWWNVHRHRIAPQVHNRFDGLMKDGTVSVHAGFLAGLSRNDAGVALSYRVRGTKQMATLPFDWLVNCTGMERAGIGHSPLLEDMQEKALIATDPLGLGIMVDQRSRILRSDGAEQPGLFAIGALTAGQFWEITAVPDIRVQTQKVADEIIVNVRQKLDQAS